RVRVDVRDVLNGATEDCPGRGTAPAGRHGIAAPHGLDPLGRESVVGYEMEELPIESKEVAELSVAQSSPTLRDGIKPRLAVGRRAGGDAKDLARRRLLLLRLRKLAVPRLQEFRRGLLLFPRLNQLTAARLELLQRLSLALQCLRQARLELADP